MQHWNLNESPASPPELLHSRDGEGRVVLLALDPGQELLVLAPWPGEGHYRGDAAATSSSS